MLTKKAASQETHTAFEVFGTDLDRLDQDLTALKAKQVDGDWVGPNGERGLAGQSLLNASYGRAERILKNLLFK